MLRLCEDTGGYRQALMVIELGNQRMLPEASTGADVRDGGLWLVIYHVAAAFE